MSPILVMLLQLVLEAVLWWIKNKMSAEARPAAEKAVEEAYAAARAQRSARPLLDLLRRLRGA